MDKEMLKFEEDLLSKKNQEASVAYLQDVQKIEDLKNKLKGKKVMANMNIEKLQLELFELEKQGMLETDEAKIKKLISKKRDIRSEIDEFENIKNAKYNKSIKEMLKEVTNAREAAQKENEKFLNAIEIKRNQHKEELNAYKIAMQKKMDYLDHLIHKHAFSGAQAKYMSIAGDKSDW